jgi:RNA polymerase sigma-70 factor, ECF subfamily
VAQGTANFEHNGASADRPETAWRERGLRDAVRAGDSGAWRILYDQCFESLYAYVHVRTGREVADTEEVVQDCWMTAVRKIGTFDPARGTFESWLRGIAENLLRNHRRRRSHRRKTIERARLAGEAPREDGSHAASAAELAEEIALVLTVLPARYQAVLRAKYEEHLGVAEIAARWGEPAKAIESLLSRARAAFREAYARRDGKE